MRQDPPTAARKPALRIVIIYAAFAAAWILLSDQILLLLIDDPEQMAEISMYKGWSFVAITALLLYGLLRHDTHRIQTAEARQSETLSMLELFIKHVPASIAMLDKQMRYVSTSQRWQDEFAGGAQDIVGRRHIDVFPYSTPECEILHRRSLQGESIVEEEDIFTRPDGTPLWMRWEMRPWYDSSNSVGGVMIMAEDITVRKQIAAELVQHRYHLEELVEQRSADLAVTETRLRLVIESTADGIIELDSRGIISLTNPAACDMLQYSAGELLGRCIHQVIHHDHPTGPSHSLKECTLVAAVSQGKKLRLDSDTFWRADGTPLAVTAAVHPIWRDNKVAGAVMSFSDITERSKVEHAREAARLAAEEVARIKSDFLANMSHEIRTPMNAIIGMAHLIRKAGLSPEQNEHLKKLENSSTHLLNIINDILDLSKIDAGKFSLESVPVYVEAIVANVVSMLHNRAQAKGLQLISKIPAVRVNLLGDPTRLQQALLNYVSNAIKFTQHGSITVRASVVNEDEYTAQLRFEVIDTGVGIPPDAVPRLFLSFEQADNSTTRKYGGTGLGLSITRKIAQLMGGDAGVSSRLGSGSTFWFTVRLQKNLAETQPARSLVDEQGAEILKRDFPGLRVLLAEDEAINREITTMMLEDVGLMVDTAEDGSEAVHLAKINEYDLILMDMQMPNLDGLDATRQIRQLPEYQNKPILAMTANAFKEDKERCLDAGMDGFITKPTPPKVLYATLVNFLTTPEISERRK